MPNYTENYNLKKPLPNENYNIQDHNDNMDIIDAELKKLDENIKNVKMPVTSVNSKTGDVVLTAEDVGAETPTGAQAKVDTHANSKQTHGISSGYYIAKTSRSDQLPAWNDIQGKPDLTLASDLAAHQAKTASINAIGHVYAAEFTATLSTSWSGSAAPYTQTVTINGITSAHNPIIDVVMSGTYSTDQQRIEQWGYIYRAVTGTNQITFYASEKPTVSLPIRVKVVM